MPKRVICCECSKQRERMRPVVKQATGWIDYVCPRCWKEHRYAEEIGQPGLFFKIPEPVN